MLRETESNRLEWATACADAEQTLKTIDSYLQGQPNDYYLQGQPNLEVDTLRRDLWALEAKGIGRTTRVSLAWIQNVQK
jgi:hypothetical protein